MYQQAIGSSIGLTPFPVLLPRLRSHPCDDDDLSPELGWASFDDGSPVDANEGNPSSTEGFSLCAFADAAALSTFLDC